MLVEVQYKEELVEMSEKLMDEMESKIYREYEGKHGHYILSCGWDDGHLYFFPDGPWEC